MATELELNSDNLRDTHWLGEIVDNKDPLKNGRCKVKVYGKFDLIPIEAIPWAACGNRHAVGQHIIPAIGDIVAITFDNGNIYAPVYTYNINQNKNLKKEVLENSARPQDVISFIYDIARNFRFYKSEEDGMVITTGKDKDAQPMLRFIDNKIYLNANNIFIATTKDDESEPAVRGETLRAILDDLMNAFNAHTHPTPSGPSGTPINVSDVKIIQGDIETIKHVGGVEVIELSEEQMAAADSASLSGGDIATSTFAAVNGSVKPDPEAGKKLQKEIDSYDDKSIVVKKSAKGKKNLSVPKSVITAMKKYGITTPLQKAHFLAQIAHESGNYVYREEIASGAAYEGRKDLGNVRPGDGVRFKGRGYIQITGRANYAQFSKYCGEDLTANPAALATKYAADTATWFWKTRNLNSHAKDDSLRSIKAITRRINGGFNGLQDRVNKFQDYWAILQDDPNAFS